MTWTHPPAQCRAHGPVSPALVVIIAEAGRARFFSVAVLSCLLLALLLALEKDDLNEAGKIIQSKPGPGTAPRGEAFVEAAAPCTQPRGTLSRFCCVTHGVRGGKIASDTIGPVPAEDPKLPDPTAANPECVAKCQCMPFCKNHKNEFMTLSLKNAFLQVVPFRRGCSGA